MLRLVNIATALLSFVIVVLSKGRICDEFSSIVLFPILYLVFSPLLIEVIRKKKTSVYRTTGTLFVALQWIRLVLSPAIGSICGFYGSVGSRITSSDATMAAWMMLYEAAAVSLFAVFLIRYSGLEKNTYLGENMTLSGDKKIYSVFILFSFGLMLLTRKIPFHFVALSAGTSTRLVLTQVNSSPLEAIIMYGLTFLVVLVIAGMHKKYLRTQREKYFNIAMLAIILRISLISSESRLSLIYQTGTGLMLMRKLFPKQRRKTVRVLLLAAGVVIGLLTVYKVFYAFLYSSYLEAIASRSSFGLFDLSAQLDSYFYGVKTVARNLSYVNSTADGTFRTWVMDIVRNTFGVHYFFRENAVTTVEAYNRYIYYGRSSSGYLFSSIAYGCMYYGIILGPIATIINFSFACYLERKIRSVRYIELYYIMCLAYIRFGVSQFSVFGATWNYVSRTIIIGTMIVGLASIGRLGSRKRKAIQYRPVYR